MKNLEARLNVLQSCLDVLQMAQDNANDALDELEQEFGSELDGDLNEYISSATNELGLAIEQLETIFDSTQEKFYNLDE